MVKRLLLKEPPRNGIIPGWFLILCAYLVSKHPADYAAVDGVQGQHGLGGDTAKWYQVFK